MTLGDVGSIASVIGVALGLPALLFAILQLKGLKGEARAAREASEATRRAIGRDFSSTELTRLDERVQGLKGLHRTGNRESCLDAYPEIRHRLQEIRRRHPGLSGEERANVLRATVQISEMEAAVEMLEGEIPPELVADFNGKLTEFQTTLFPHLEDLLQDVA